MSDWRQVAFGLITKWEGLRLKAYPDPATGAAPWTVGYGAMGPSIGPSTVWTRPQAEADLRHRIDAIGTMVDGFHVPLNDNQKGALVSLAYNIGIGALSNSTLLRLLRAGDISGASAQFLVWNKAAGKVMSGLSNRRADEKAIFDTPEAV